MPFHKFPPKGYRAAEYPLPHNSGFSFSLCAENEAANSTIVPLIRNTEACLGAGDVEVNPRNANFVEDAGVSCFTGSIVPRLNLSYKISLSKGAIETDKLRQLVMYTMPIYTAFLDSLDASDEKSGDDIETILELEHDVTNKDTQPIYTGTKMLDTDPIGMSNVGYTEVFGDWGLTTNTSIEAVAFDTAKFYDAMQYYTNGAMLRKVVGPMKRLVISRDRPFLYHSANFTYPTVKRMNPYTFCGLLFHLPQVNTYDQFQFAGESTAIGHINVKGRIRYDEWNPVFDQAAI